MNSRFKRLFCPRSIAVIGGGAWCAAVVEQNRKLGFTGDIWPVHPSHATIGGIDAYCDLDALPGVPDAAFIGVNRHATVDIVGNLSHSGAGGAVCFASGFGENADGVDLQSRLLQAAGQMPVLGPNCYGFVNYVDRALLWPDQHGGMPVRQGVAIIAQSSNIAINLTMQRRGLPLAYAVTVGNQAQSGLAEIGAALLEDERVTALGLHIEGVGDLSDMQRLAELATKKNKSVVVLKVGMSSDARQAALTHTAALAGTHAGAEALFQRLAFVQVDTLPQFIETLKVFHVCGPLSGKSISSMSCSGGEAGLIADAADRHGLNFPSLTSAQSARLKSVLGPLVTPQNPLDYHTHIWRDRSALTETFSTMMTLSVAVSLVILDFPRGDRCNGDDWKPAIDASLAASANAKGPLAVVSSLPENMPEPIARHLMDHGIIPLCGIEEACFAISKAASARQFANHPPILLRPRLRSTTTLNEVCAKNEISNHGILIPQSEIVRTAEHAAAAAQSIGFPVVLKGEGHAHKSENAMVRLNLTSRDMVRNAAEAMKSERFLVEEMIADCPIEMLVGVVRDEAHGFVLTIAAGGILAELLRDRQSLLLPATHPMIEEALQRLKMAPLLEGFRGQPAANLGTIIKTILALQDYVIHHADELESIEINPLLCGPSRVVAADALITRKAQT
ncbi:MAG: acetate--CoA ligase family protein [Alphaproteobacteria bacterium]|nr:acetate--CoA ligase family protein [Alphaproteobacteria bacterium]